MWPDCDLSLRSQVHPRPMSRSQIPQCSGDVSSSLLFGSPVSHRGQIGWNVSSGSGSDSKSLYQSLGGSLSSGGCTAYLTKKQLRSIHRFEFFAPFFDMRVWVFILTVRMTMGSSAPSSSSYFAIFFNHCASLVTMSRQAYKEILRLAAVQSYKTAPIPLSSSWVWDDDRIESDSEICIPDCKTTSSPSFFQAAAMCLFGRSVLHV